MSGQEIEADENRDRVRNEFKALARSCLRSSEAWRHDMAWPPGEAHNEAGVSHSPRRWQLWQKQPVAAAQVQAQRALAAVHPAET